VASAKRVTLYVDGFNLYYGLLVPNPAWKWLDLAALARSIRPGDVTRVRYFTAKVRPVPDPSPQIRQRLYLKALATLPDLSIYYGHFTTHPTRKALVHLAPGGPKTVEVWKTEEKGSDVNLAMYLLLDGVDGMYDEAVVISGDSDLVGPVREADRKSVV
jgi:uncharacterized LabA/DUF88 family protein